MKPLKIIIICLICTLAALGSVIVSKNIIQNINSGYVEKNPVVHKKTSSSNNEIYRENKDVDNMIFHSVNGTGETVLPVKYEKNFVVYQKKFYVTKNEGRTWMQVPDDTSLGYAKISEYMNDISQSNVCISNNNISIVYGGRGSENIDIITSDEEGKLWSVHSISKTASHNLKNAYDKMYIDFLNGGKTGYIAAVKNYGKTDQEMFIYHSVNTGVTWEKTDKRDTLYNEITAHFGL